MPGLTFDDSPSPDPQSPLVLWLDDWIVSLGTSSRRTSSGYVSDVAGFAELLCEAVRKPVPELVRDLAGVELAGADDSVATLVATYGFSAGAYVRARELFSTLVLVDLAPRNLARALARHRAGHADNSSRRAAAAWSSFCRYLVGQEVLAANPMNSEAVKRPKEVQGDPTPLTYAELERVFAVVLDQDPKARHPWPARDLAAAALFVSTGVRLEEAITAGIGDFFDEPDTGTRLRVWGKGNKPRTIPVHEEATLAVRAYLADREGRLGKPQADDRLLVRWNGEPFNAQAMRYLVGGWYARAGVRRHPGAVVHALRHSFGTSAIDSGATITEVQKLMGHASLATTQRYLAVVGAGLQDAIAAHPSRTMLRRAHDAVGSTVADYPDPLGTILCPPGG